MTETEWQAEEVRRRTTDVLAAAADLLDRDGWCQHEDRDDAGGRCAGWAIRVAVRDVWPDATDTHRLEAEDAACRALLSAAGWKADSLPGDGAPRRCVTSWNDAPYRTGREIIDTIRVAASS